ncbi:MAG: stalk domain-containing protein, partial [Clostridia bacterium]|nr:stalk domain-containing protein [Clostridia bacterium]
PVNKVKKTTDTAMLDKVIDAGAKSKIYEVNLYDIGMTEIPKMFYPESYGLTTAAAHNYATDSKEMYENVMKAYNIDVSTNAFEVFVDGTSYNNARYPDNEYMTIKRDVQSFAMMSTESGGSRTYEERVEALKASANKDRSREAIFIPSDDARSKKWAERDTSDVYIWFQARYGWADEGNKVYSIDKSTGAITCCVPTYYGPFTEGNPVYIYNFFDEITPGEFYIDRSTGTLYMCLDKMPDNVTISTLETAMFKTNGAKNLQFKNLKVGKTRGECFLMEESENIVVDNCEISLTSIRGKAVYIDENCRRCGVKNSTFKDINGGVRIYAGRKSDLTKGECYIVNCEFERFARLNKTYTTAFHLEGVGNRAAYNEIHEAEHMAAGWGGNYQSIEFNEFYNVCTLTDDAAAVYAGRSLIPRGNVIKYNYFHEVGRQGQKGGQANGSHGVYLDDGYSSADVVGNVFENVANYGVFLGGGRDNVVYNNVMINCGNGIFCDNRYLDTDNWTDVRVQALQNDTNWRNDVWKEAFPELYNIDLDKAGVPANNRFENNLMYNSGTMNIYPEAQENGVVDNNWSTNEDPGFVDAENGNFLFKKDAKVYSKIEGFMEIPFTRMGRCIERAEDRIKAATVIAIDSPRAYVNGKSVKIDEDENVVPEIINDKTYLPVRFLAEANGFDVSFDDEKRTAVIKNDSVEVEINIDTGAVIQNGQEAEALEVTVKNGRTMLPMRAVSEMLGKDVFWDDRGFISVSSIENLFDSKNDDEIIDYLYSQLNIY